MNFPGFSGRSAGWDATIAGFEDFCNNARIRSFPPASPDIDMAKVTVDDRGGYRIRAEAVREPEVTLHEIARR